MIKKHLFTHSSDSKLFLVSDLHFGHLKIAEKRGFANAGVHDEHLIKTWNERVRPCDIVLNLGDMILGCGDKGREKLDSLLDRLNGYQYFIFGNHNSGVKTVYWEECEKIIPNKVEIYPITYRSMTFLGSSILAHVKTPDREGRKNHFVFCSHFAHRIWIDSSKTTLHACGHSHSSDKMSNEDYKVGKRLDVGIENFGGPISFDKFLSIMDTKNVDTSIDHHNEETSPSF